MRCSRCHAENPAGMRFCGQCAAPLGGACPSCGAANPPENRFCGNCAAPLDAYRAPGFAEAAQVAPSLAAVPAHIGEMKQVTVLFCDIVGSTALAERLGAEAMHDLVNRFLEVSIAEVRRYDGAVPQFAGDGFMAVFGAPRTYEDHVRRALLAALGIQRALSGEVSAADRGGFDLPVRIGIHTGPVVFGPIGGNFGLDTAIGDTANVASRLQAAAEPGTIVLSETTRLSAQSYARLEQVGPLALKGKAEAILAYRLLGVSRRAARDGVMPERTTSFVDRGGEVAALESFVDQAENGRGRAVGIVGEPGIGKSRIVDEIRRRLAPGRFTWVEGRCLSYGAVIPYLLILDLLRGNCGIVETDTPEQITEKVRDALRAVGMDPEQNSQFLLHVLGIKGFDDPPAALRPETVKQKTFEVFRQLAVNGSQQRPLILVLEDLHWVDTLSAELAGFLAESIADARILILATYRPEFRPPWIDKSYAGQIPLQPLGSDDSLHVVRSVLGQEPPAGPVAEEIVAKADGNPLFLEQLALHAGEAKSSRSELMVPTTIHDVVMARIDRLPNESKQLLQTAAVIGREFSLRLLRTVCQHHGALEALLRELCRLEFLYERAEVEGTIYVFRHALTQETAYGSLLERHRRAYHGAVGEALEELYRGRTDEVAELLAVHFGRSHDAEKSVDYAILAAEKSQRRWANSEALAYFDDALRLLDSMADTQPNRLRRIDAVLQQAEVKFALGRHTEHIEALEGIRKSVDQTDDPRRRATWHYWTGFLHSLTGGRSEVAIEHCSEAAAIAAMAGLDEINAFATSCLALAHVFAGGFHEALAAGERAVASFESRGNLWWASRTLWHLSLAANALGRWDTSLRYCRRALDHGTALKDLRLEAAGWRCMASAYIQQGDLKRGLECCDEALALAPIPYDVAHATAVHGYGQIKSGRVDAGIMELAEAVAWFKSFELRQPYLRCALWLAEGYLFQGRHASARPLIADVLDMSRETGYRHLEGLACWLMGDCLRLEASAGAEDCVEIAMRIFEQVGARNDLARAMVTRAALRQAAGDINAARALIDQACEIFGALGTSGEIDRTKLAVAALNASSPTRPDATGL
jgi:class 3 adenylate cyclase/tetratricopeptide (TPR) repeat protein